MLSARHSQPLPVAERPVAESSTPAACSPATPGARDASARASVELYHDLGSLPDSYLPLFGQAAGQRLFHSLAWYRNFVATTMMSQQAVRIYGVEQADAEPSLALLACSQSGSQNAGVRSLDGLSNFYSSLYGPLYAQPAAALPALRLLARHLASERPRWDRIELRPMNLDELSFPAFETALRESGFLVDRFFCFGNWYLEVEGRSFREYFASRPKKLSQNAPRSRRKLEASGRMRLDIVQSRTGLSEARAAYHEIYNSSWKQAEAFPGFIDGLLETAADHGWLRLGVIHIDGIPAAAQIWFVLDGTASIFKMAYDSRFTKDSVGTVLSSYLMEHVIDVDKVAVVDYLSGDDAYKRDWMSHRRERWGIIALNPRTLRGLGTAARHYGGRTWRRFFPPSPESGADKS